MYRHKNSTNGESVPLESRNINTRTQKPDGKCFLPNEQRNSLHEHQMEDSHPLRILSESNLTVVSSFGGSLNDLNIEECENREDIAEKLSFFTVPDIPHSNSHNMDIFDDSVIGQRFKEFERLHRQQNPAPLHLSENINEAARNPTVSKPILSTFASRNIENNNQKILPLGEYVSLNDTCESTVSNLYCEPFNSTSLIRKEPSTNDSKLVTEEMKYDVIGNKNKLPSFFHLLFFRQFSFHQSLFHA